MLRPGLSGAMVGLGLREPALGLLDRLLSSGLIIVGRRYIGDAGLGGSQCLVVGLLGDVLFFDQAFVALQVVLDFHVVGFRLLHLGMGSGELFFSGNDSGFGVIDVGRGETSTGSRY